MTARCSSCSSEHFVPRRLHRHGPLAVFLGHALLLPGVLLLVAGSMGVVARPRGPAELAHVAEQTLAELEAWQVPSDLGEAVVEARQVGGEAMDALTDEQRTRVLGAQVRLADVRTRSTLGDLTSGPLFRWGLVLAALGVAGGFVLTRKRSVLCCANCALPARS